MEFNELQKMLYIEYVKNGYKNLWSPTKGNFRIYGIAELALVTTEISEAIEELRNKQPSFERLMTECADIVIRTLNFMSRFGGDAEQWILKKHQKNMKRGKLHGRGI